VTAVELSARLEDAVRVLRMLRRRRPTTRDEQVRLDGRVRLAVRAVVELEAQLAASLGLDRLPEQHDDADGAAA
jgi:hypothetical protein